MPTFTRDADGRLIDYYELLSISRTAREAQIVSAYRRVAFLNHPDKNGGSPESHKMAALINVARDTLVDEELRAQYDAELAQETKTRTPKSPQKHRARQSSGNNKSTDSYRKSEASKPRAQDHRNRYYAASSASHDGQPKPKYGPAETPHPRKKPLPNPDYGSSFEGSRRRPGFGYIRPADGRATKLPMLDPIFLLNGDFVEIGSTLCYWARNTYSCLGDFYYSINVRHSRRTTKEDKETEMIMIAATDLLMEIFFFTAASYDAIRQRVETVVRNWAAYHNTDHFLRDEVDGGPYVAQIEDAIGALEAIHRQNLHTTQWLDSLSNTAISDLGGMTQVYDFLQKIITSWTEVCELPTNIMQGIRDIFSATEHRTAFTNQWERHGLKSGLAGYSGATLKLRLVKGDTKADPVVVD